MESLIGRKVRLKPEFVEWYKVPDGYYDDDDYFVVDETLPEKDEFRIDCGLHYFINHPDDIFTVKADFYGVDLYRYQGNDFEIDSIEPTHQILLDLTAHPFFWDIKYFDVLKQETKWVVDEEFNQ